MPQDERPEGRSGERIAKLLARAGIASRREVERMIAEGRVKLGDAVVTTPATVLENLKGVTVDGKPVKAAEPPRLFGFHKPDGLITAERDPAGRPTIYSALRNALPPGTPRLMPVGRLDLNTEGLLLLTNDGELKRAMELPSSGIPRTYRARTFGDVSQGMLEELIEGVTIEGMNYGRIDANMERSAGRNKWIELTLTEGKNREVRRVLEHLGLQVSRLLRTRYGPFHLGELQRGSVVEIRQKDVEQFRKTLKLAPLQPGEKPEPASAPIELSTQRAPSRAGARSASRAAGRSAPDTAATERRTAGKPPHKERPPRERESRSAPNTSEGAPRRSPKGPPRKEGFGERGSDRSTRARGRSDERGSSRTGPNDTGPNNTGPGRAGSDRRGSNAERPAGAAPGRGGPPRSGSPRDGSPRGGSPRGGSPRDDSPRGGPPRGSSPKGAPRGPRK
jgi:23S rRNA pseudouridine2605 synthase